MQIRPMRPEDAAEVLAVYQAGLDCGQASFETTAPGWAAFDAARLPDHRFVAVDDDGRVTSTEAAGIWTIQSGVFPENTASLALHERAGFRVVGTRERLARHAAHGGRWRDVVLLERRSPAVR